MMGCCESSKAFTFSLGICEALLYFDFLFENKSHRGQSVTFNFVSSYLSCQLLGMLCCRIYPFDLRYRSVSFTKFPKREKGTSTSVGAGSRKVVVFEANAQAKTRISRYKWNSSFFDKNKILELYIYVFLFLLS